MPLIYLSNQESDVFGLRFFRAVERSGSLNVERLLSELLFEKADLCRMKIRSNDSRIFEKLHSLNMPCDIHTILIRNSKTITGEDEAFDVSELDFELFEGQNADLLTGLVKSCIDSPTGTNYHDTLWDSVIPNAREVEAAVKYATSFNIAKDPSKRCWLVKKGSDYVGFVMCEVEGDVFEGIFYGIAPNYRGSRRYAKIIMGFLKKACAQNGWKYFENDVVFQNMASLKSIVKEAVGPVGTYLNLNIKPFFSLSGEPPKMQDLKLSAAEIANPSGLLLQHCLPKLPKGCLLSSFKYGQHPTKKLENKMTLRVATPIREENMALLTGQLINPDGEVIGYSYLQATPFR